MTFKIKNVAVFFLFTAILAGSITQTTGSEFSYTATYLLIFITYLFLSDNYSLQKYQFALIVFVCLYFYSVLNSIYVARSIILAVGMFSSFLIFCVLNDLVHIKAKKNDMGGIDVAILEESEDYLSIAKYALAFVVAINAITLILFYIDKPIRVTGQFRDYSQSAFSILLAFALIQPLIKKKTIFTALTLIYFLGFFTTFSRTAIFLLIVYLVALFIIEFRNKNLYQFIKILALILLSYLLVQTYPLALEQDTVSRGISDLNTLNSRTFYWQAAWEAIKLSPVFGHGFNTFEYTGIQALLPFQRITSIHNDYLQVWHDLGVIWLLFFILMITYASIKFAPFRGSKSHQLRIRINDMPSQKQIAWVLMICMFAYMSINFILLSQTFQIIFAILMVELLSDE